MTSGRQAVLERSEIESSIILHHPIDTGIRNFRILSLFLWAKLPTDFSTWFRICLHWWLSLCRTFWCLPHNNRDMVTKLWISVSKYVSISEKTYVLIDTEKIPYVRATTLRIRYNGENNHIISFWLQCVPHSLDNMFTKFGVERGIIDSYNLYSQIAKMTKWSKCKKINSSPIRVELQHSMFSQKWTYITCYLSNLFSMNHSFCFEASHLFQ